MQARRFLIAAMMVGALTSVALSGCANGRADADTTNASRPPDASSADQAGRSSDFDLDAFDDGPAIRDPFEGFNRRVYSFNAGVDRFFLEPISEVYGWVLPQFARDSVRSIVDNLKTPVWLTNDLLQGEWRRAGVTFSRFTLNTTLGVGGIYDFADNVADLPKHDEDFGQTLGSYGVGNGPYLMLPFLGPATMRDAFGRVVDTALDPLTYATFPGDGLYSFRGDDILNASRNAADIIDIRHRLDPVFEVTKRSDDPYLRARTLYYQSRAVAIANGRREQEEAPDLDF